MGGCCSSQGGGNNDAHTEITMAEAPTVPHGRVQQRDPRWQGGRDRSSPRLKKRDPRSTAPGATPAPSYPLPPGISEGAVKEMMTQAEAGFEVLVLLANGYGIEVTLTVDKINQKVRITKESHSKELEFSEINKVIYTPSELAKIKTSASLDDCCAALCTERDSSCIVFCFASAEEAKSFVAAAYRYVSI